MASVFVSSGGSGDDLYEGTPGTVAEFRETGKQLPGRITFEGKNSDNVKFMTSGVDYKQSVDVQFQTSLEKDIYVYVFGDNMGEAMLHGRAYFPCEDVHGENGFDQILKLYAEKKLSTHAPPVMLMVGKKDIRGYLTSLLVKSVGLSDEPGGLVYDFTASISTVPSLGSSGSGVTSGS